MAILYLDCFAGISGNMFLGALLDLGLPPEYLRQQLAKLAVGGYELKIERVQKLGISAWYVDVKLGWTLQQHRHLPDIYQIIDQAELTPAVQDTAKRIFGRLAEAEAKVHGTSVENVHFHEVGAVDAIVDIVGAAIGVHYFQIERIYTSTLRTGTGFVKCSHGRMPVPAPATAELLRGISYETGEIAKELVTPTGAAIVAALASPSGLPKGFRSRAVGYGAGTWDLEIPNVLRASLGEAATSDESELLVAEANLDDLNPQLYQHVMDRLFAAGAKDVWLTPVIMKKGRPATLLSVLLARRRLAQVAEVLLTETTTLGLRYYPVDRIEADRRFETVATAWGPVRIKLGLYDGRVTNIAPEYEDCQRLAEEYAVPLKRVWQEALSEARRLWGQEGGSAL